MVIDLWRQLTGRDPTPEEMEEARRALAEEANPPG
jgi:hypothetical protein